MEWRVNMFLRISHNDIFPILNSDCQIRYGNVKNRNGDDFLNIFSLNIRSLPKNGGELLNFLGSLKT